MKKITILLMLVLLAYFTVRIIKFDLQHENSTFVSGPVITDLAGKKGAVAVQSIFKVLIPSKNSSGTAFLHKSGNVITAAHILEGSKPDEVILLDSKGQEHRIKEIISDYDLDLALLVPSKDMKGPSLSISTGQNFSIGAQVTTWGFPNGYSGLAPLLSVGYLSGENKIETSSGKLIKKWVVNAAFNKGNSGGPLIDVQYGTVIGVVTSKMAPIPPHIISALEALKSQESGLTFEKTHTDGTKLKITQGEIIADIFMYLSNQTQLVIGHTVFIDDLRDFLKVNGIKP